MRSSRTHRTRSRPPRESPFRPFRGDGASRRYLALLLVLGTALAAGPRSATAQVGSAIVGAGGGLAAGLYTATAIYVTEARFGQYIFSTDDVLTPNPRLLPLVVLPTAGAWLGAESGHALGRAALWGGAGFLGGAALGAGAGHLVWRTSEGRWAGAVIGSALGFLAGAVLGGGDGLRDEGEGGSAGVAAFAISIPVGASR